MAIWGFDVAIFQSEGYKLDNGRFDLSDLERLPLVEMRENGCRFGIAKVSMQLSKDKCGADHIRVIKEAGFDSGAYHWCDPIGNWPLQRNLFTEQLRATMPKIRAFDVEQHWANWNDRSDHLTEKQIVENFEYLLANVPATNTKALMYSAYWVMKSYVKTLYMRLGIIDTWMAHYTMARAYVMNAFGSFRLTSWDQFNQLINYLKDNWKTWFDGSSYGRHLTPPGMPTPKIFQFDSKTILPGAPYNIDLNLFLGTDEEYDEWMGHTEPDPDPEPDPGVTARLDLHAAQIAELAGLAGGVKHSKE